MWMRTWYDSGHALGSQGSLSHTRLRCHLTNILSSLWCQEPDFEEYEELYADLNLEDEEEFYAVGMEDHSHHDDDKPKDDHDTTPKKHTKEPEPELSPAKPAAKTIPKSTFSMIGNHCPLPTSLDVDSNNTFL